MKLLKYIILSLTVLSCFYSTSSAQQIRFIDVDFSIKKLRVFRDTIMWNDTMMVMKIDFKSKEGSPFSLEGSGTLSLCYCYCDSLWDAWPEEVGGGGIPGTATLGFSSGGDGTTGGTFGLTAAGTLPQTRTRRRRGTFAIRSVQGGNLEEGEEFVLPITFKLE